MELMLEKCPRCHYDIRSIKDFFSGEIITCVNGHTIGFYKRDLDVIIHNENRPPDRKNLMADGEGFSKKLSNQRLKMIEEKKKLFNRLDALVKKHNVCHNKLNQFLGKKHNAYFDLKACRNKDDVYIKYIEAVQEHHHELKKDPIDIYTRSGQYFIDKREHFNMTIEQFSDYCGLKKDSYKRIEKDGFRDIRRSVQYDIIESKYRELKVFKSTHDQAKVFRKRLDLLKIPIARIIEMCVFSHDTIQKAFTRGGISVQPYMAIDNAFTFLEKDPIALKKISISNRQFQ